MFDIAGKKITVVGLQKSGLALSKLIKKHRGVVRFTERKPHDGLDESIRRWITEGGMECEFNAHTKEFIAKSDLLVLSPGVAFNADPVRWAKEMNIPVLGEIEFAFQYCTKPVIAVTGSNGKTTVSTLISGAIKKAGFKSCLCGNIGTPFSSCVLDLQDKDYVVLEISSFQLESVLDPREVDELNTKKI